MRMNSASQKSYTCNDDLRREREKCSFVQEEITYLLYGGKEITEIKKSIENVLYNDPEFNDSISPDYMSHEERYSNELRKGSAIIRKMIESPELQSIMGYNEGNRMIFSHVANSLTKDGNPFMIHYSVFIPAIMGQGTSEQKNLWLLKALNGGIIGTYAQTEMGHGTNLKGLETTATYDPQAKEFILNSPTTSSYKFWPGGLGKTANYAVVMAQLYTGGECHGPHNFMVPIRDGVTHRSLPGIMIGELGAKFGVNTNDNGYLRFQNYRIPRDHMLMKHAQVEKDGTYIEPINKKLTFGTMVYVRVMVCLLSANQLLKAVTIATRYSAVRRQSELVPGEPEPQIIEYQTQQEKLFPNIAAAFALLFAGRNLKKRYHEVTENMEQGNLQLLPELHAISCGLKALSSGDASKGIDVCRRSCGGYGYLSSSNLPRLFTTTTAAETYEGENTVLWLQLARFLVKVFRHQTVNNSSTLLAFLHNGTVSHTSYGLTNEALLGKWQKVLIFMANRVTSNILGDQSKGMVYELACNKSAVLLVSFAQAFMRYFVCSEFVTNVEATEVSSSTKVVLKQLCRLYFLHYLLQSAGLFLRAGIVNAADLHLLEEEKFELYARLRPIAVCLVDSFGIHDRMLDSTIGAYDGNVYERILDEAKRSPLNKTDVPDAYYKYLQPLIKSKL